MIPSTARLGLVADRDTQSATLLETLLPLALSRLAEQYVDGEFVFTTTGADAGGGWTLRTAGRSVRYGAIVALGLLRASEPEQRTVLDGQTAADLVGQLAKRLDDVSNTGDVALICWAAAEAGHSELPHALARLGQLDRGQAPARCGIGLVGGVRAGRGPDAGRRGGAAGGRTAAAARCPG